MAGKSFCFYKGELVDCSQGRVQDCNVKQVRKCILEEQKEVEKRLEIIMVSASAKVN